MTDALHPPTAEPVLPFLELPTQLAPPPSPAPEPAPTLLRVSPWENELPIITYCTTPESATALVREMLEDAAGTPLGLDIETAPIPAEAERCAALVLALAQLKGELKAARKAKAPPAEIAALVAERKRLAVKAEYAGKAALDPHRSRIRLVQLYGGGKRVGVIDIFRTGAGVLELLQGVDVVAHNAAFELSHLEAAGIGLGAVHDTLQAARLTLGGFALKLADVVAAYLGIDLDKTEQKSDWAAPELSRTQLEYVALDAVMVQRLAERIFPLLGPQALAYETQAGAVPAVARMQHRGILLDLEAHAALMQELKTKRIETGVAYQAACAENGLHELARKLPETPAEKRAALEAILPTEELAVWKRTPKSGELSTERSEMRRAAHYPPITALIELSRIDKIASSFGTTLAALVSPITGRIHANYRVASTNSGRASCSKPNIQQAPRDPAFRALFKAAPGHVFVSADYASMELRAAAHISGDHTMTAAFQAGKDMHRMTASRMLGKSEEAISNEERQAAKAVNFGAIYGSGAARLVQTAWDDYGLVLTIDEAVRWIAEFKRAFWPFTQWRDDHHEACEASGRIVIGKHAKHGVGRFFELSRVPAGKSTFTRCCNLPIQGACADASMLALTATDQALFDHEIDGGPVAWLHDEIILEVAEADAEKAAALLERAMLVAFAETFPGAPLKGLVETHLGADWAALKSGPPQPVKGGAP
jgi:DNA polymerase-1